LVQVTMHKMPRIWTQYLELLVQRRKVTRARRTFDRALQALPITQHDRVWVLYLVGFTCPFPWSRQYRCRLHSDSAAHLCQKASPA
jgi:hypothetical protein